MTKTKSITRWARNTHGQPNLNVSDADTRIDWTNFSNSATPNSSIAPKGSATSMYRHQKISVPKLTKNQKASSITIDSKPWTFTGHDFDLQFPTCGAYISKIVFTVEMKITGNIQVKAPYARFNFYHGTKSVSNNINNETGWKDGYYYYNPNKKLSNSWQKITYEMSGADFRKRGYPLSELNNVLMGIDLKWYTPTKNVSSNVVSIKYVACTVHYEVPDQSIVFLTSTTENDPVMIPSGNKYIVKAKYTNNSNASCCSAQQIQVKLPPNVTARLLKGNYSDGVWTVPCTPHSTEELWIEIQDFGIYEKSIELYSPNIGKSTFWYYSEPMAHDVGEVTPYPDTYMQKGVNSCITFKSTVNASDGEATFFIDMAFNKTYSDVHWSIVESETDNGISINRSDDTMVVFNVPPKQRVAITFKGCFIPRFTGDARVEVSLDTGDPVMANYIVEPAPHFILRNEIKTTESERSVAEIGLRPCVINFITHRIASTTELGAYVIDCGVAPFDKTYVEKECSLTADIWEPVDYIGCVPLEYHHYDPDSTYSNKAISDAYKNKVYKGKEGEIEENISLKFKARPWQVPTLQGLTKLDKPTPINANHKCFEGDPLNHRGWAVLSEIKAKRTNPLWYDVEAEVDYITHDIHTKFQIFKEKRVTPKEMPYMTAEVFGLGENLATGLDYFNIDTDGGFIYDEEGEDGAKNIFSLDEGQTLSIATRDYLSDVAIIRFDWYSNSINEIRENNIERVFKLVDENGDDVLQYEYTNFKFYEDYVMCDILLRVKTVDGGWYPYNFTDVDLRTELEVDPIIDEEPEEVIDVDIIDGDEPEEEDSGTIDEDTGEFIPDPDSADEPAYEEGFAPEFNIHEYNITQIYGSSLEFVLNGKVLKIYDSGYNGSEVTSEDITLVGSKFSFESVWKNDNRDGSTEDIISYIDISLSETILETDYADQYSNLIVSPFPIPRKTVVFTRESEEGPIYYLSGEEPFKYLLEPYYQYHCGCDLLGGKISIFDLNNSYTHYYIENGLVRFGFNKYNGRLYLAKWDIVSKEWIPTHYFHMVNEPKFAVESLSDDKIVIKAGTDTFFTIWRGRPFIGITHPSDPIYIDSNFNYCLSDNVNGKDWPYPVVYSFMNTDNLLPAGIGGKRLDYDEFTLSDDDPIVTTDYEISLTVPSSIIANNEVTFTATVTPTPDNGKVHLYVDGVEVGNSTAPFTIPYTFENSGTPKVYAVYVGDDDEDGVAFSPVQDIVVETPQVVNDEHPEITGNYSLRIVSAPSKFTYRDGKEVVMELRKGSTGIQGEVVELSLPDGTTQSIKTGNKGRFKIVNNKTEYVPGNHHWGARFYDPNDLDHNNKLICKALKWIKIEKAKPTFTHTDSDGKVSKGKSLTVKLNGVDAKKDPSKAGLAGKKVVYSINGGKKTTTKTDEKGKFKIKFPDKGTKKLKVMFAGSVRYDSASKTFTIKVI